MTLELYLGLKRGSTNLLENFFSGEDFLAETIYDFMNRSQMLINFQPCVYIVLEYISQNLRKNHVTFW